MIVIPLIREEREFREGFTDSPKFLFLDRCEASAHRSTILPFHRHGSGERRV